MLTPQQVAQFERDGFLRGGSVLTSDEVDALRLEIERVIRDREQPGPRPVLCHNMTRNEQQAIWQIVNIWQASEPFRQLLHHPRMAEEVAQLTRARELRIWHDQIQYKPAGTGGVNMWHQDWPYWDLLSGPYQVTAWVALDDVDPANGCMSMVPGSHQWGKQIEFLHQLKSFDAMPAEFDGHPLRVVPCPVGKGEVHYHHALTWHGSPANTSGRPRRAIAFHLMTEATKYVPGAHCMRHLVTVAPGATLSGAAFPVVWAQAEAGVGTTLAEH